jgi:hypothetical protein
MPTKQADRELRVGGKRFDGDVHKIPEDSA